MRMACTEAKEELKKFYILQEERVQTYLLFDEGYQAYLASAPNYNFPMYRQLVHEITVVFKKISDDIIKSETKLKNEYGFPNISNFISKVQEEEKNKLELTAKLQIAQQNVIDYPDEEAYKDEMKELKESLNEVVERINEHLEELKYESEELYE